MKRLIALAALTLAALTTSCENDTPTKPTLPGPPPPLFSASGTLTRIQQDKWRIEVQAAIDANPATFWPNAQPYDCPIVTYRLATVDTVEDNRAACWIYDTRSIPIVGQLEMQVWIHQEYWDPQTQTILGYLEASGVIAARIPDHYNEPVAFETIFVDGKPGLSR